nr:retrovirus-related Pol polyprotein from transposon TNT 1-94 [Tanacetum cinerariifolium]
MRNIKMTMSRMQLNSKFVNNMLLEWVRFVTAVKLNRGLRDSNYDQLYDYLKQHEAYANENKMMLDRFTQNTVDPLALMSNVSHQQYYSQSSTTPPFISLMFIAGGQDNVVDEDVDEQPVQDLALNVDNVFQADDCDAFDSDVDEAPTAQTMFMANLSSTYPVYDEAGPSYDSDILSKVHDHDHYQDAVCKHHEVHEMHDDVQPVVDSHEVQPALYNGHEIIKTNHVLAIVHNSEETLEIAEITRKKMNDKMKD